MEYRTKKRVINYLDDYLFIALLRRMCNFQVNMFLEICNSINLPVSDEKTYLADTVIIIFLGFLIDSVNQIMEFQWTR